MFTLQAAGVSKQVISAMLWKGLRATENLETCYYSMLSTYKNLFQINLKIHKFYIHSIHQRALYYSDYDLFGCKWWKWQMRQQNIHSIYANRDSFMF